jgi:murein L,D-transpeptidase YcbB/YkuD
MRRVTATILVFAALLGFVSPVATTVAVNFGIEHRLLDRLSPLTDEARIYAGGMSLEHPGATTLFYERRNYIPAWSHSGGPSDRADRLLRAIRTVVNDGFTADRYDLRRLERILTYAYHDPENISVLVELDLMMTDAYLRVVHDLSAGLVDPGRMRMGKWAFGWTDELMRRIERGLVTGDLTGTLERCRPGQAEYERLRSALGDMLAAAQYGDWPEISEGGTLKPGMSGPRVRQLRQRLDASGDLPVGVSRKSGVYDEKLANAVRVWQERNGLAVDGYVGDQTRTLLNVGPAEIARKIELNLERWRWLPEDLGRRHLWVDITDGRLKMQEYDSLRLNMRVMIGRVDDPTPAFSDTMYYLVMNPYWEIPASIVMKKLYPYFSEDPTFFERHGLEVFTGWRSGARKIDPTTVNWKSYDPGYLPFRFRQKPGRLNAMGRIKFMFPNRFHIYIHDTPSRYLFARERYAYTSGCVRVRRPIQLAEALLEDTRWWTERRLRRQLRRDDERVVHLKRPIPVHLAYFTVHVSEDGRINLRPDIYGWDEELDAVLPSTTEQFLGSQPVLASGI